MSFTKILFLFLVWILAGCANTNLSDAKLSVHRGFKYLQNHQFIKAKKAFLLSLKLAPQDPSGWYGLAYFMEKMNKPGVAERDYKKAIHIQPTSSKAHNNYGTYLCHHKRYKEAIKQFLIASHTISISTRKNALKNAGICALLIPNDALAQHYFLELLKPL